MATLGPSDLKDISLPTLWDNSEILKFRLEDGSSFEELVGELRAGLQVFNADGLMGMTNYGGLVSAQTAPEVEYATGVTNGVEEFVEYKPADPRHGATTGHIIGIKAWNRSMGWTMRYLHKARKARLDADIRSAFTDINAQWQRRLLRRFFKSTADTVGTGKSVPFADGGTADSSYVPYESKRGDTFASTHSHFKGQVATLTTALVDAAIKDLWEHGHDGPYNIIIPEADVSTWTALSGFRKPSYSEIYYTYTGAAGQDRAAPLNGVTNDIFGYWEGAFGLAQIWATPRLATKYYGVFKPYGPGDPRNPLRVRFDPNIGMGWNLAPGMYINAPQLLATLMAEFEVGVGEDRTNGVAVFNDAGASYTDPAIAST